LWVLNDRGILWRYTLKQEVSNKIYTIYSPIHNNQIIVFRIEYRGNFPDQIKSILLDDYQDSPPTFSEQKGSRYLAGHWLEFGYKRAIIDPEFHSILAAIKGFPWASNILWVRKSTRIFIQNSFYPSSSTYDEAVQTLRKSDLFNPQIHEIFEEDKEWKTLIPVGTPDPIETVPIRDLSMDQLVTLSEEHRLFMPKSQLQAVQKFFQAEKRDPTDGELEMLAQSWCDHCFHTTWKSLGLLKRLKKATLKIMKNRKDILSVFEDNAGVMSFYDGYSLAIKGETHNSPTLLAPAPGVETMLGGVLRDILGCGQGFYPIGGMWVFGTQPLNIAKDEAPKGCFHPQTVARGMIKGYETYTNPMGVPNLGGGLIQHSGYAKPLALGLAIGLGKDEFSPKGVPQNGDLMLVLGGSTGRDGIHGATTSSAKSSEESKEKDGAHVQIGAPAIERFFMEAIIELRDKRLIRAITDFGAGGLSSAAGEMGQNTGIEVDLSEMPLKYKGLSPWEILLSESQERMLLCIDPKHLKPVEEICRKYFVEVNEIGKFTQDNRCRINYKQQALINLPFSFLTDGCPIDSIKPPAKKEDNFTDDLRLGPKSITEDLLLSLVSFPDIADQSIMGERFDASVQGMAFREPYGPNNMPYDQSILIPFMNKSHAVVTSFTINPHWSSHPVNMAKAVMISAISKCVVGGAKLSDIALCDNFYTPPIDVRPDVAADLKQILEILSEYSVFFGTPFISGKDSSSGSHSPHKFESEQGNSKVNATSKPQRIDVPVTLCVSAIGKVADYQIIPEKKFQAPGEKIWLVPAGITTNLSGSIWAKINSKVGNQEPLFYYDINLQTFKAACDKLHTLFGKKKISAISSIEYGGAFRRIFEMSIGNNNIGAKLKFNQDLFKSNAGSFVVVSNEDLSDFASLVGQTTQENNIQIGDLIISKDKLIRSWSGVFGGYFRKDDALF